MVDLALGTNFSKFCASICASTFNASRFVRVEDYTEENFRGARGYRFTNLRSNFMQDASCDGVGTKLFLHAKVGSDALVAHDLVAMTMGDQTRQGSKTVLLLNTLSVSEFGHPDGSLYRRYGDLMFGLQETALKHGFVLWRGETAEMGPLIGSPDPEETMKYDWTATAIGVFHPDKVITGNTMVPGDMVVALQEHGFRCNGMTLARRAFERKFGSKYWEHAEARKWLEDAAKPALIYDSFLNKMHGWERSDFEPLIPMKCIVHITGGGIPEKFGRDHLFRLGLSADLENLWRPPQVMGVCKEWSGADDYRAYDNWGGGQGMIVVLGPGYVQEFLMQASLHGFDARVAGKITARTTDPRLTVHSMFSNAVLTYKP